MRWILDALVGLGLLVAAPLWLPFVLKRGRLRARWSGRLGGAPQLNPPLTGGRVLLHAVSVGEVNSIRGLVEVLEQRADLELVIASTTETGLARARTLYGERHPVVRWPLDFHAAVDRFLRALQPTVIGLVELEVWPRMTAAASRRGIRTVVVSGRLSQRSHRRYRKIRPLIRRMFSQLSAVAAQDADSAERFRSLGVADDRIEVTGTMKWDAAAVTASDADAEALAADMGLDRGRLLIVGGSTAPGEDALLREACPPECQLLCAPRRPEWWDEAASVLAPCVRRSTPSDERREAAGDTPGRFLLDSIGDLSAAYRLADIVVVGRSFGKLHGSDPIEPVACGAATIIGPACGDFTPAVRPLVAGGGLIQCQPGELAEILQGLAGHPAERARISEAGRQVVAAEQGATAHAAELLVSAANAGVAGPDAMPTPGD